jgi:GNAT superfamily N-acetyltransferase
VNPDRETVLAIQRRALRDFVSMMAGSAPGSRLIELDGGVAGAIVPAVPERSIVNSVTYTDATQLAAGLDRLAGAYAEAGVSAWTVWVPEHDEEAVAALVSAGHVFDGEPMAMVLDLADFDPAPLDDLTWDAGLDPGVLGAVNDAAYGIEATGGISAACNKRPPGVDLRLYRALVDGETACVLGTIDHDPVEGAAGPDCGVYFVAVPPRFRGRRLSGRLLTAALVEARERGCVTSSLQASAMGSPVYLGLGYRPWFRMRLYERRASGS